MSSLPLPCVVPVAGVSFRQTSVRVLVEEQVLIVRRDEENPHDPNACVVETLGGEQIGFVPRELAKRLTESRRKVWSARVSEVLRGETWGVRVEIKDRDPNASVLPNWEIASERVSGRDDSTEWGGVRKRVRGLSGRDLGVLIKSENGRVLVEKSGAVVSYPAQIVTVEN